VFWLVEALMKIVGDKLKAEIVSAYDLRIIQNGSL